MTITAKVLADTYNTLNGQRLITFELYYPRFIHSEFMTYRMFSRNASSSRAIPVKTMVNNILADPAMPLHWGKNQKGMQAHEENRDADGNYLPVRVYQNDNEDDPDEETNGAHYTRRSMVPQLAWKAALYCAVHVVKAFDRAGYHKQIVNRLLEPFMHIRVIVTATDWDNMFTQRIHPDAQPEFQVLAKAIKTAMLGSNPVHWSPQYEDDLGERYHHLPYILPEDKTFIRKWSADAWALMEEYEQRAYDMDAEVFYGCTLMKVCAARCARVSYRLHDGTVPDISDDLRLATDLTNNGHWSPFEHAAVPCGCPGYHYNLHGFVNFRCMYDVFLSNQKQRESALGNAQQIAALVGGVVQEGPDGTPFVVQSSELTEDNETGILPPTSPKKGRTLN